MPINKIDGAKLTVPAVSATKCIAKTIATLSKLTRWFSIQTIRITIIRQSITLPS